MNRVQRRGRTLPLSVWLILTVVAIVVSATVAEIALGRAMVAWQQHADQSRLSAVRRVIGTDATRWRDPAWQRSVGSTLATLGVEAQLAQLSAGSASHLAYMTPGARAFLGLDTSTTTRTTQQTGLGVNGTSAPAQALTFERITISRVTTGADKSSTPSGIAFLWFTRPASGSPSPWLWPLAAGGAILLVLAVVVWLLGRSVLRPLAAMNRAVEGIAGGALDVRLPSSAAREVAEVGAALEGMSAALRESLERQAALEAERRRLEEERKLFIGAVAHDLRTPLFMLRGYLKGLESGVAATPEKMAHYVSACSAKADALERLIADLFDYTRLEYLEQEPERAPLELGALLREAVEGAQPQAAAKGVAVALAEPEGPYALIGDGQLLARVVGNLLDNALRHTPAGGHIDVRLWREDACLVFAVEDSGPGIAAHDLPHLFTPLYRGETSRNRRTGGAGLGLTIARRILRAHGGDLVAANAEGGGALFTATLPAARQARPQVELATAAAS